MPYRWLPRELDLLHAFAERCVRAVERFQLLHDLAAREEQVRRLAGQLLEAEHDERLRISRELHDEAGQSMLFLRLHLEMIEKTAPPDLRPRLSEAREVSERIIDEIRRVIASLRPSAVEELGLPAAIRHLAERMRALYPVRMRLRTKGYLARPGRTTEAAVYRVVQECFQNVARHSSALHVNLSLKSTDKLVELNIEDDGSGFDLGSTVAQPNSFGLKGMRERVTLLGGRLQIRSSPGEGTAISVEVPLQPAKATESGC